MISTEPSFAIGMAADTGLCVMPAGVWAYSPGRRHRPQYHQHNNLRFLLPTYFIHANQPIQESTIPTELPNAKVQPNRSSHQSAVPSTSRPTNQPNNLTDQPNQTQPRLPNPTPPINLPYPITQSNPIIRSNLIYPTQPTQWNYPSTNLRSRPTNPINQPSNRTSQSIYQSKNLPDQKACSNQPIDSVN